MRKSLYLINPRSAHASYFGAELHEHWGFSPVQAIADLATATVAALAPASWNTTICDEYAEPIDLDTDADFVGITGKVTQASRMLELAAEYRRRGKTVVIGGPFASLSPETFRGRCDVLVVGELEEIANELFGDLERGDWKREYVGDKPDLASSPLPRWDLYPNDRAVMGCIQTSRGCPFECEFCDVIQYLGRKQRHKSVEQILTELETLYEIGYRSIFLADDNFTVYRKRAKEVLSALADWQRRHAEDPVSFATQLSIDATRDPEIMQLQAAAGMTWVFIGIETPNQESLKETKKRQNVGVDLLREIEVFLEHGISVTGGMIVGFDHDGPDIFQRQYDFAMASPIPMFSLGALTAPVATPLYDRLGAAGRLVEGPRGVSNPWETNVVPTQMTREELTAGLQRLCNRLYHPAAFGQRVVRMIECLGPQRGPFRLDAGRAAKPAAREIERETLAILHKLIRLGPEERRMWAAISAAMEKKPESQIMVMMALYRYAQVRCLYETESCWEPRLATASLAPAAAPEPGLVSLGGRA